MNQNSVIHLENYKEKHKYRVYYANRCNYCFSMTNLKKCGYCKAVNYCTKKHQKEDWPFHKPTCIAFKKIKAKVPLPENCDANSFYRYRIDLLCELTKLRSLPHCLLLTEYEQQICLLPSVCVVCFKKPSKKYRCKFCQCVDYCSEEHKRLDEKFHESYCSMWWWCKLVNSSSYSNGYKVYGVDFIHNKINIPKYQKWPESIFSLYEMMKKDTILYKDNEAMDMIGLFRRTMLVSLYIPAAIIINSLEKAEFVKNRHLITKSHKGKPHSRNKLKKAGTNYNLEKNSTMVVHFAIADGSELTFDWNKIACLLTDWLINIERVHFVVTDPYLQKCDIPPLGHLQNVEVTIHKRAYEEVNDLPKPDVIVLLECDRYFRQFTYQELNEKKHKIPFFKYSNVPVILCDGHFVAFQTIIKFFFKFSDLECIVLPHSNNFKGLQATRKWTNVFNMYTPNERCVVFKKK